MKIADENATDETRGSRKTEEDLHFANHHCRKIQFMCIINNTYLP